MQWTSSDWNDIVHQIKNPFEQAKRGKYGILEKLKESPSWQRLRIGRFALGHAAFFPDIGDGGRLAGPDAPRDIIGDAGDLENLAAWTARVFSFWAIDASVGRRFDEIGIPGLAAVRRLFARVATTRPLLYARLKDEEFPRGVMSILGVFDRRQSKDGCQARIPTPASSRIMAAPFSAIIRVAAATPVVVLAVAVFVRRERRELET